MPDIVRVEHLSYIYGQGNARRHRGAGRYQLFH